MWYINEFIVCHQASSALAKLILRQYELLPHDETITVDVYCVQLFHPYQKIIRDMSSSS